MTHKTKQTIDLGINWENTVKILILVLKNGTDEGKRLAEIELIKMGQLMDLYNQNKK